MLKFMKNNSFFTLDIKKNIATMLLFFTVALVYNLLRPLKITLALATPGSGAEILPYLKLWGVVPGAIVMMYIYTLFSRRLSREKVFYAMLSIFITFFTLFLFFLYPYRSHFELTTVATFLQDLLPEGMHGLVLMIRYWYFSLFYVFSELWSTVVISTLLWGFINETTKVNKAKKSYGTYALSSNLAPILAGPISYICSCQDKTIQFISFVSDPWQRSLSLILGIVLIASIIIILLYWYLDQTVANDQKLHPDNEKPKYSSKKMYKFTLTECFSHLLQSRYLILILMIVISYNLVFNMTDLLWANQLKLKFGNDSNGMNAYLSHITTIKGITATFLAIFLTSYLLRKYGWKLTALITPLIIIITSFAFFPLIFFDSTHLMSLFHMGSIEILMGITLLIGSMQNCLTRASKYTLFDATKEMAFIPLSVGEQRRGKAIIDGIASRIGKSGGAVCHQVLLLFCTSIASTVPYIICIVVIFLSLWVYAVVKLDKEMKKIL